MALEITKEIKIIHIEAEKEIGFPLAKKFWDVVEGDVGNAATEYDGDPEGQEEYIKSYRNVTERYISALSTVPSIAAKPSTSRNGVPNKLKKVYHKPFERRLHLLEFIWGEKEGIKARANWKHLTAVWNKEHPHDQKTQAVLKVEYYRSLKDKDVTNNLIALRILPGVKLALTKTIDFRKQHPEAKNLNELIELEWYGKHQTVFVRNGSIRSCLN